MEPITAILLLCPLLSRSQNEDDRAKIIQRMVHVYTQVNDTTKLRTTEGIMRASVTERGCMSVDVVNALLDATTLSKKLIKKYFETLVKTETAHLFHLSNFTVAG